LGLLQIQRWIGESIRSSTGAGLCIFRKRLIAEIALACIGCAFLAFALVANREWFDAHFLPSFFVPRQHYLHAYWQVRIAIVLIGMGLAIVARHPIARFIADSSATAATIFIAVVLGFVASEALLRQRPFRAAQEVPARSEPSRRLDPYLGWTFIPSRVGYQRSKTAGVTEYAFDRSGYRVRRVIEPVDLDRPTIIFTGESMVVGERLGWQDTIPAQTEQITGIQSANIAVSGYASDQAYLRLKSEIVRFRRPIAVVMLFTPSIFDRNLDDDRPHLASGLVWRPPAERWRLSALARRVVRYRSAETIERGIETTREVLRATIDLARSRGAVPVILVPQFGQESPRETDLRHRILDQPGFSYLWIQIDPRWRVRDDGHPDARAAHAMAEAIATRLAGAEHADADRHEIPSNRGSLRDGTRVSPRTSPFAGVLAGHR